MDNRIRDIKNMEIRIKEILVDTDSHFKTLGEFVCENETGEYHNLIKKKKLAPGISEIKRLTSDFDEAVARKEKLLLFRKKAGEISDQIKQIVKKNNEIEKDNDKHYEGIAEALYTIYKRNPDMMSELELYFSDIIGFDEKNRELEKRIQQAGSSRGSSLMGRILGAGEKTILYSRRKLNSALLVSAYRTAGKKMCADRIFESSQKQEVKGMFTAYLSNRKIQEELEIKTETLLAEKGNYDRDIDEILQEFGTDPDNFIKGILSQKEEALMELGKTIYSIVLESEALNPPDREELIEGKSEANDIIEGIKKSLEEINDLEDKAARLRRELEIEQLEREIEGHKKLIEKKSFKINELEKEIGELEDLIKAAEDKINSLGSGESNT